MKNLFKRMTVFLALFVAVLMTFNFIYAAEDEVLSTNQIEKTVEETVEKNIENVLDTDAVQGAYKLSDDTYNVYLPFVRYASDRIVLDKKNLTSFGSVFSGTSIEVTEEQEGIKCLFAADTVRIEAPMEYAIVFAGQNVIINSEIKNSIIVFGGSTVTFTENAKVAQDAIVFASNLETKASIDGNLLVYAEKAVIDGTIQKDLRLNTEELDIANSDVVKGNVYVETTNKGLNIKDEYKDAIIRLIENEERVESVSVSSIVVKCIIVSLVFALLYTLLKTKTKLIDDCLKLSKKHTLALVVFGAFSLLLFPLIVLALLIVSLLNLGFIAGPVLVIYLAFLICVGVLSTLVVGSLIIKFVEDKYLSDKDKFMKFVFEFLVFVVLFVLAKLPIIGGYITWALVILANGIVLVRVFKNKSLKD